MKLLHEEIGYAELGVRGKTEYREARNEFNSVIKSSTFEVPLMNQIMAYRRACQANIKVNEQFMESLKNNAHLYKGIIRTYFDGQRTEYELTLYTHRVKVVKRFKTLCKDNLIDLCTSYGIPVYMHGVLLNKQYTTVKSNTGA